ncbi:MAG: heme biosynthesis HemY N-terminal domain-containing protein [Pseudomonadota bacterium]
MLAPILRILIFILVIAIIAFGAGFLLDADGAVRIAFNGREIELTVFSATLGLIGVLFAAFVAVRLFGLLIAVFRFVNGEDTAIWRYFNRNRERRGFEALAESMVALASGEGRLAISQASKAERKLNRPELTNLVNAQAAELAGDTHRAIKYYKSLLGDQRTRFVGVQGLMKQKLAEGDTRTALALAEKAFALKPRHSDTLNALFHLQTTENEWRGASETIQAKRSAGELPADVATRRRAVLALADARHKLDKSDIDGGKASAMEAHRLAPGLIPAAVLACEFYALDDRPRLAAGAVKKAWAQNPHPDLAATFAELKPDETSTQRAKRFKTLLRQNPSDPESKMLEAELALADEDFPSARRAVRALNEEDPTVRTMTIMAAIERGEGANDDVVRGWLSKALEAPRGNQWVCDNCGIIHGDWAAICTNCESFDTISWRRVETVKAAVENTPVLGFTAGVLAGSTEMATEPEDISGQDIDVPSAVDDATEEVPQPK